jgi:putative ABC transport system ATP-binding protein
MSLFAELHKKGNTIIMVTHEEDIAKYAHRVVFMRDGNIEKDEINENPTQVNTMSLAKEE